MPSARTLSSAWRTPPGTKMYRWFKDGRLESTEGDSIAEGIGQGRITENLVDTRVDEPFLITYDEALPILFLA